MSSTLIVYLHGFRSSPRSSKAAMTGHAIRSLSTSENPIEWYCPQLVASPKASMDMVNSRIAKSQHNRLIVIVSSLFGYYSN